MKKLIILIFSLLFCGCVTQYSVSVKKVALLPEDRIFTLPANQQISLLLDGKPLDITFTKDMKVVDPKILVGLEEKLNNTLIDKTKSDSQNKKVVGILGSLFAIIAAGLGIWKKYNANTPKK